MTSILEYLSVITGAAVLALGIAASVISDRFFKELVALHPQMAEEFPKEPRIFIGSRGGPVRGARLKYLQARRFESLSSPRLQDLGRRSILLANSHAVAFATFAISMLLWGYFKANGP